MTGCYIRRRNDEVGVSSDKVYTKLYAFRLDDRSHVITSTPRLFNNTYDDDDDYDRSRLNEDVDNALKDTFRPANILFTHVQICLMFWVFGTNFCACRLYRA